VIVINAAPTIPKVVSFSCKISYAKKAPAKSKKEVR
jgi:hypothetical protein